MNYNDVTLSTERLILRGIKASDAKSMLKYRSEPQIFEFQNWRPKTLSDVEEFISTKISKELDIPDTWYQLGMLTKESNEFIGDIGIHFIDSDNLQVEIGFTLALEYQGKGYAIEAVTRVISYLFSDLKKHRIFASVDPENKKSIALLERIGMRKEAHFKKSIFFNDKWTDDIVYGILDEEWINEK